MKRLLVLLGLLFCSAETAWGACHAVGPVATGTGTGADFNNRMAMPSFSGWVRGDTYYLIAGVYPNKLQFGPTLSGTNTVHIWRATNADHGQGCGIGTGYVDATMGQPAGPANLKLFEGLTAYMDLDGKYHPTPWQTSGGGLNVQTGYGFYINMNTACGPGACWALNVSNNLSTHDYTISNVGIYGRGDAATDLLNTDDPIRIVDNIAFIANDTFQYIGIYNSSSTFMLIRGVNNLVFDHIWGEHNHATGGVNGQHSESLSMSGNSHGILRFSVFKDIEGTAAITNLGSGGNANISDDWQIYGNVFFDQPGNPTGRTGFGNGILSCINDQSSTNWVFINNTIANLPGFTRVYFLTGSGNCAAQTGLVFKNNIYWSNPFPGSANQAATPLTGFDYQTYIGTNNSGDTGANTNNVVSATPSPFVSASPVVASDFFLATNATVTPWLNTNAIAPANSVDGVGTTRALSRGAFEKTGATAALSATPSPVAFGNVNVGNVGSVSVTVTNVGTASATLSSPFFTLTPSVFTNGNTGLAGQCANATVLAAAASCVMIVKYTPVALVASSGTLTINGTVSTSVSLSGTGTSGVAIPAVPTGLAASPSGSTVNLTWNTSTGSPTNYVLRRATISGGPYTTIASPVATSYSDLALANNTYFYQVAAHNSAGTSAFSAEVSAVVATAAAATPSPSVIHFGSVVESVVSAPQVITVSSTGTANLVLGNSSAVSISGANAADFAISANTCTDSLSIAPAATCQITVTATPSAPGLRQASVVILSNDPASPDSVSLDVTGVSTVSVAPTSLAFGNQLIKKVSSPRTVVFSNQSGSTITFSSVALTTGTQYAISANACTATLATGATCNTSVTFTPTTAGAKTDTLTFTFTGVSVGSPQTVSITGTGKKHGVLRVGAVVDWPVKRSEVRIIKTAWKQN